MRYNSRNKKRGARSESRSNKKINDMKSPLMITLIVLILFVTLVIFSVVKGPIKQEENINPEDNKIIENINIKKAVDPTVNINLAISSNNINKCNNDEFCINMFYFAKAVELEDCEMLDDELVENCRDNIYLEKALNNNDKSHCSNIINIETKNICLENLK